MKAVIKLKNGTSFTQDWGQTSDFSHGGDFLEAIKTGVRNNASVTLESNDGHKFEGKWSDVYSIEFIL